MRFVSRKGKSLPASPVAVLGLPSFGNVGQMAIDCLLSSLTSSNRSGESAVEQLGLLQSEWVSAVTGYEEFSSDSGRTLCMPVEVYGVSCTSFVFIQQRAPCISAPDADQKFANELSDFLFTVMKPRCIVVLSGASLQANADESLLRSNRLFEVNARGMDALAVDMPACSEVIKCVENSIPWSTVQELRIELSSPPPSCDFESLTEDLLSASELGKDVINIKEKVENVIPGSPLVGWLLTKGEKLEGVNMLVLGKYCREGNNVGDAVDLAGLVARVTGLLAFPTSDGVNDETQNQAKLSVPKSWDDLLGPPLSLSSSSMF